MMNEWRDPPPYTAETGFPVKIVAAMVVALGFGAFGAIAYETAGAKSQVAQPIATHPVTAQDAPAAGPTDLLPAAAPEPLSPPAEPLKNAAADSAAAAAPVAPEAPAKAVKLARVQRKPAEPREPQAVAATASASENTGDAQPVVHETAAHEPSPAPESPHAQEGPAPVESAPAETPATPQ